MSVLEGGYSTHSGPLSPLSQSVTHHVRALVKADNSKINVADANQEQINGEGVSQASSQHAMAANYFEDMKLGRKNLKARRRAFDEMMNPHAF